ncbi:MerR family transcriptional regulator [Halobacillus sp. ACCC02827]|uniref:MerR family transcriptional regulator n=1 Tax=Halobacillus sp. ACCC02827 TaxID=3052090 RepID=UPI0025708A9E|nr:MerR family transcriptional regulator [Halobacillus sp. ACCC02827]WJE17166.1 MerR family transcriptional regulator [Halobacillus sp. ACCC02827]
MFTIRETAEMLELKPHTLRYYEREGIITSERDEQGYRTFTDEQIGWLRFVKKLRETQMPIQHIKEYAELYVEGEHTSSKRLELLEEHRRAIQEQLRTLKATEEMLDHKIETYKEYLRAGEEHPTT